MTNAAFGIALVRPAGWVAATLGVMTLLLYSIVVLLFDMGGVAVFQALLLISLLSGATLGARYLEEAERNAFAQGFLVADLHRRIARLFRQYLSPDVAQALVDDPSRANLGGEVADVSVLSLQAALQLAVVITHDRRAIDVERILRRVERVLRRQVQPGD